MEATVEIGTDGGVIQDKDITVCFVNTEARPKRREFVGLFVKRETASPWGGEAAAQWIYILKRIERVFYPHPQAPEDAEISAIETTVEKRLSDLDPEVSPLVVLYHAQESAKTRSYR